MPKKMALSEALLAQHPLESSPERAIYIYIFRGNLGLPRSGHGDDIKLTNSSSGKIVIQDEEQGGNLGEWIPRSATTLATSRTMRAVQRSRREARQRSFSRGSSAP